MVPRERLAGRTEAGARTLPVPPNLAAYAAARPALSHPLLGSEMKFGGADGCYEPGGQPGAIAASRFSGRYSARTMISTRRSFISIPPVGGTLGKIATRPRAIGSGGLVRLLMPLPPGRRVPRPTIPSRSSPILNAASPRVSEKPRSWLLPRQTQFARAVAA